MPEVNHPKFESESSDTEREVDQSPAGTLQRQKQRIALAREINDTVLIGMLEEQLARLESAYQQPENVQSG